MAEVPDFAELRATAAAALSSASGSRRRAAAVRTRSGRVYAGVELGTSAPRATICAEAVALGAAIQAEGDDAVIEAIALTSEHGTTRLDSPCGFCRELYSDYVPDAVWCVEGGTRTSSELVPLKYERSDDT